MLLTLLGVLSTAFLSLHGDQGQTFLAGIPNSSLHSVSSSNLLPGAQFSSWHCPIWEIPMSPLPLIYMPWVFNRTLHLVKFLCFPNPHLPKCQSKDSANTTSSLRPSSFLVLCCQWQVHLQSHTNQLHDSCVQALPPLLSCVHDLVRWRMVTCVLIFIYLFPTTPTKNGFCIFSWGKERLKSEMNWDVLYLFKNRHYRYPVVWFDTGIKQIHDIASREEVGKGGGVVCSRVKRTGIEVLLCHSSAMGLVPDGPLSISFLL